jgi:hypothetical protein
MLSDVEDSGRPYGDQGKPIEDVRQTVEDSEQAVDDAAGSGRLGRGMIITWQGVKWIDVQIALKCWRNERPHKPCPLTGPDAVALSPYSVTSM